MSNETHQCHFCGEYVTDGVGSDGERHWLSDCRPDLVEHDAGPMCTWPDQSARGCYAYQDTDLKWTDSHSHFYTDGPM